MQRFLTWLIIVLALGSIAIIARLVPSNDDVGVRLMGRVSGDSDSSVSQRFAERSPMTSDIAQLPRTPVQSTSESAAGADSEPVEDAQFLIRGRVVDDLGNPVSGFAIDASSAHAHESEEPWLSQEHLDSMFVIVDSEGRRIVTEPKRAQTFDDEGGVFQVSVSSAGQWELIARMDGDRRSAPVVVSVPQIADDVVIELPRLRQVSGVVIGPRRESVAHADIYLSYAWDRYVADAPPRVQSDERGEFLIDGVLPGNVQLLARHPEYTDSALRTLSVDPSETVEGVEIQLREGGRVEGTVDPTLGSVADRSISLISFKGTTGWREARTDSAGRFVLENVIPQDYVIELRPPDHGDVYDRIEDIHNQPSIRKRVTVIEGETTRVAFGAALRPVAVRGMLTMNGSPVAGLTVRLQPLEGDDLRDICATGTDGRFELQVYGPGNYVLTASSGPGSFRSYDVTIPEQDTVELALEVPGGAIFGFVLQPDGHPLPGAAITAALDGAILDYSEHGASYFQNHYRETRTGDDGGFEFRLLDPGTYILRAPDGFRSDPVHSRIPFGRALVSGVRVSTVQTERVDIHLLPECRISGLVADPHNNAIAGALIQVMNESGEPISAWWESRTDASGHFEIDCVAPGTYSVRVRRDEHEVISEALIVEEGKTANIRIEMR